jgi:hypothetical protein
LKKIDAAVAEVAAKLRGARRLSAQVELVAGMPEEMRKDLSRAKFTLEQVAAQWERLAQPVEVEG